MENDRRCRSCGAPLSRRKNEDERDWNERKSCNRSCHTAWKNAKPIWQTFVDLCSAQPDGCIEWRGHKDPKGYGRFTSHGGEVLAHRIAYSMHYGSIPDGMHVLHRCDNPSCVNPRHLFPGTNQDNVDDKMRKGRAADLSGTNNPNWRHGRNCASPKAREIREARDG